MTTPLECLTLSKGTVLFSEGDIGDHAYLIHSGEIEITVERDGRRLVLARRAAGEIIGEMALLDRGTRSASARVSADAEVIAITKRQIDQRIADTDPILRMCLGVVIERYRDTLTMIRPDALPPPAPARRELPGPGVDAAVAVLTLERELERALVQDEFELFLQPIMRLSDRTLAGFEALIRWNHPVRGRMSPNQFIPVAESSGLVVQITEWMLREAAKAVISLVASAPPVDAGADPLFVSINVSGHDLLQPGFADSVMQILADANLPPHHFKLEVTESMLMKDPIRAGSILDACRRYGMGIAVDDFGTGYSSLSHLSTLPITTLKIDRCFVQAMLGDPTSRKIVNTIRLLARELDIPVVAEGIETELEAAALDAIACEYGQGFLFGRPMPLAEAIVFRLALQLPTPRPRRACA